MTSTEKSSVADLEFEPAYAVRANTPEGRRFLEEAERALKKTEDFVPALIVSEGVLQDLSDGAYGHDLSILDLSARYRVVDWSKAHELADAERDGFEAVAGPAPAKPNDGASTAPGPRALDFDDVSF